MLQEAMFKLCVQTLKQNMDKLRKIESSFVGVLGLTWAGQDKICISSRANYDFDYTFPLRNSPNHWPDHMLRLSFAQQVYAQGGTHWYMRAVQLLKRRSMGPVVNGPQLEVKICKDTSETYVDCVVKMLQFSNTEDKSTYTKLRDGDKIIVRIKHNGEMHMPCKGLPITINIIEKTLIH